MYRVNGEEIKIELKDSDMIIDEEKSEKSSNF